MLGSQRLNVDLTAVGGDGCSLRLLPLAQISIPVTSPASFPFMIPNFAGFSGQRVLFQAAVLAPGTNPLGLATTNGLEAWLGF